jgi:NitT/TauT family transport system substrate-binding protein
MNKAFRIAALVAATYAPVTVYAEPEVSELTIGLPVTTSTFLPLYVAEENGYFQDEGIDVDIVAFKGGTDLVRGMIAGAVEVGVTSLAGVNVGIAAEQPLKAFYGGFNMAVFDWYAVEGITSVADSQGKRWGVSRLGSSTDLLTRFALQNAGLDPDTDVTIVQGGGSPPRLAAMDAGQLDVNIFAPPEKFIAAEEGYNLILRQADLAPDYPFHVFFTTEDFLANNPETIKAILRASVRGIRAAKANKDAAVSVLVDRVGLDAAYAGRTYDDFIEMIFEDGRMPSAEGMKAFWDLGIMSGDYDAAWDEEKYLDRTYIDSFDDWKPAE